MLSDRELSALEHIVEHGRWALQFAEGASIDTLRTDPMRRLALARCLEVVSEASRRLSEATRAKYPELPWREIADAGNFYRHEYDKISTARLLDTVAKALPPVMHMAEAELARGH